MEYEEEEYIQFKDEANNRREDKNEKYKENSKRRLLNIL